MRLLLTCLLIVVVSGCESETKYVTDNTGQIWKYQTNGKTLTMVEPYETQD